MLLKCTPSIFSDVSFCIWMLPVDKVQLQLCFLQTCRCLHFVVESLAPEYSAQSRMVVMMGLKFMLIFFLFFSFSIKLKSSAYALRLMLGWRVSFSASWLYAITKRITESGEPWGMPFWMGWKGGEVGFDTSQYFSVCHIIFYVVCYFWSCFPNGELIKYGLDSDSVESFCEI